MSDLTKATADIRDMVVNLLRELDDLRQRHERLLTEHGEAKKQLDSQKNTILALEESNKIVKLAGTLVDAADDIPALKKKLNEYIREIDDCIRFLSERQV